MDAKGWNGDDNTTAADLTDAERDERERELEEFRAEGRNSFGTYGGCELHNQVDCSRCNLSDFERACLRSAQALADGILSAAGIPMARRTCERCGAVKPAGQSCGCFDNGSE